MMRLIFVFFFIFTGFYVGIDLWRNAKNSERWSAVKLAAYSLLCAVLTASVFFAFVQLF